MTPGSWRARARHHVACHWCVTAGRGRRGRALVVGLLVADDPHGEELGPASVRVAEGLPGLERDLVVPRPLAHLLRDLAEADHAGGPDRVRREDAPRRVPRDVA